MTTLDYLFFYGATAP